MDTRAIIIMAVAAAPKVEVVAEVAGISRVVAVLDAVVVAAAVVDPPS